MAAHEAWPGVQDKNARSDARALALSQILLILYAGFKDRARHAVANGKYAGMAELLVQAVHLASWHPARS
jgi:hypothetical protein